MTLLNMTFSIEKKVIAHNLKASKEQIIDDLNGVMSDIQRKMMRLLLKHLDELNAIIKELDDDIDSFMKPQEKQAAKVIQDIPGIANTSAQAIISVLGTDMERFPSDRHLASWAGLCPGDNESDQKAKVRKDPKGKRSAERNACHMCTQCSEEQEVILLCTVHAD